jgi:REP element-mobilizing transposase RayT
MPSTHLSLHYHLVFATKNREGFLTAECKPRVHQYLGGTVNGLGGRIEAVGGMTDHVHLLAELRATHTLADFMRELKKQSSIWIHDELRIPAFAWQEGYAAFTGSASAVPNVRRYVQNQEEHHRVRSFREELEIMLDKAGVKYDPRYLD